MDYEKAFEAARFIQTKTDLRPKIGIVLGSGLGELCDEMDSPVIIAYDDIPNMPVAMAPGHEGRLYIGKVAGTLIMAFRGRFHCYEGYSSSEVAFPIRVMKLFGIETFISTNAAGGLNPNYYPGAFMVFNDHINLMNTNPLIGKNDERFGERFPDMLDVYSQDLIKKAHEAARSIDLELFEGLFIALIGPNFETKGELRMLRSFGGDVVGWSSVPEVLVARHMNMKIMGLTLITDMSVPDELEPVDAQKVLDVAKSAVANFIKLMSALLIRINEG